MWLINTDYLSPPLDWRSSDWWRNSFGVAPPLTLDALRAYAEELDREIGLFPSEPRFDFSPGEQDARAGCVEALVDLARAGNREDFVFLACASGVGDEEMNELWDGTRRRLGLA